MKTLGPVVAAATLVTLAASKMTSAPVRWEYVQTRSVGEGEGPAVQHVFASEGSQGWELVETLPTMGTLHREGGWSPTLCTWIFKRRLQ